MAFHGHTEYNLSWWFPDVVRQSQTIGNRYEIHRLRSHEIRLTKWQPRFEAFGRVQVERVQDIRGKFTKTEKLMKNVITKICLVSILVMFLTRLISAQCTNNFVIGNLGASGDVTPNDGGFESYITLYYSYLTAKYPVSTHLQVISIISQLVVAQQERQRLLHHLVQLLLLVLLIAQII